MSRVGDNSLENNVVNPLQEEYRIVSADKSNEPFLIIIVLNYIIWLWSERRLIATLTRYELKRIILETKLSYLWWILDPMLKLLAYIFLMAVFGRKTIDQVPYALFIMLAIFPWHFISKCINDSVNIWSRYEQIIGQIRFPYMSLFIVSIASEFVLYMISFVLIFFVSFYFGYTFYWNWFLLSIIFIYQIILSLSLMFINAFISFVFFDYRKLLPFILNIWFFCSPALWPLSKLSPKARLIFELNPMVFIFQNIRGIILHNQQIDINQLALYTLPLVIFFCFSFVFFIKKENYINRYLR